MGKIILIRRGSKSHLSLQVSMEGCSEEVNKKVEDRRVKDTNKYKEMSDGKVVLINSIPILAL